MQDDEDPEEAICVGWDTMRIQGLRIVVGRAETAQFLYSIDMFAAKGTRPRLVVNMADTERRTLSTMALWQARRDGG